MSDLALSQRKVHFSGPVSVEHGFVLHRSHGSWNSSIVVSDELSLTTSRTFWKLLRREVGREWLLTLGYAGWGAGQLEEEIAANAWLTVPADADLLFETAHGSAAGCSRGPTRYFAPVAFRYCRARVSPRTYLAFDFGERRIGVAIGNDLTATARALTAIDASNDEARFEAVATLVAGVAAVRFHRWPPDAPRWRGTRHDGTLREVRQAIARPILAPLFWLTSVTPAWKRRDRCPVAS